MSDDEKTPPPPGLAQFKQRLDEVTQHDYEEERRQARRRRSRFQVRSLPVTLAALVLAGGVAVGATALINNDGPAIQKEPNGGDQIAPIDPSVVATSRTTDPGGGLPWILRVFTNPRGETCVVLGRLKNGHFGEVQQGRFRELPEATPGVCDTSRNLVAFLDRRVDPPRTIVYGLARGPGHITVRTGDAEKQVDPAALGTYLTVFTGTERTATVTTIVAGKRITRRLG